jgi:ribosomal protein S18 acetylase RimI-like enzyme
MPGPSGTGVNDSRDPSVLDRAAWMSLTGAHAPFARQHGQAARYPGEVSPYAAFAPEAVLAPGTADGVAGRAWDDLASLLGAGGVSALPGVSAEPPDGWEVVSRGQGVQMVGLGVHPAEDPEAIPLGPEDVPEMLALVAATRPGPFAPRTIELGTYLGFRRRGALVAMAGERLRPPGWTEISAVCTAPDWQGKGLATRLVRAVAAEICSRGDTPFLHAAATNTDAIRLYEKLGFSYRRSTVFQRVKAPG